MSNVFLVPHEAPLTLDSVKTSLNAVNLSLSQKINNNPSYVTVGTGVFSGTASQSGSTVSGSGFTSSMVGGLLIFTNGLRTLITSYTDASTLTAAYPQTVGSQTCKIYYGGCQLDNNSAGAGIKNLYTQNINGTPVGVVSGSLSSAQIQNMKTTPIDLIAAAGAGTLIAIDSVCLNFTYSTAAYTSGGALRLCYGGSSSNVAFGVDPSSAVITAASNQVFYSINSEIQGGSTFLNSKVSLTNLTAAFATGSGTLTYTIHYKVLGGLV